ncbi:MAG: hypothetical protein KH135_05215, partial [Firmicutes bacterium]|nr:hypothetical protein [Bacillota bacterium]
MNQTIDKASVFATEISYIKGEKYKENARILISLLPDYFFEVAASSTGKYHPAYALGEGGLVRHTKVVVRIAKELLDGIIGEPFKQEEKDAMIIAMILHDGLKHGLVKETYVRFDHPLLIAKFIKDNQDKTTLTDSEVEFLQNVVSSHMGPFTTNQYSDVVL